MAKSDGGSAFPRPLSQNLHNGETAWEQDGMSLRDYFVAHAPAKEIDDMVPSTTKECAEILGIASSDYKTSAHYAALLAILRYQWADAMIAEREKAPS